MFVVYLMYERNVKVRYSLVRNEIRSRCKVPYWGMLKQGAHDRRFIEKKSKHTESKISRPKSFTVATLQACNRVLARNLSLFL